ncbi:MAG: hypothetical protein R3D51_19480 [Hyphomicrobiaceae bacterium]
MQVYEPFARPANQDKKHFELGTSTAKPAEGYFADVADLPSEKVLQDAVAGLLSEQEIEDALFNLLPSRFFAHEYMRWRMGIKADAKRP